MLFALINSSRDDVLFQELVYGVWFVGFSIFVSSIISSLILAWAIKSRRP